MSSLKNMIDLLLPVGLYKLTDDSHVMCELRAYAAGLDHLAAAFDELIAEAFIQTADGYGLEFWERLMKLSPLEGDTAARRRRLMGLLFLPGDAFTTADIEQTLAALGADVTVIEDFANEKLNVSGRGYIGAGQESADIAGELAAVLPAHLGCYVSINMGSWYYWDSRKLTFNDWDHLGRTFADHGAAAMLQTEYGYA